MSLPCDSVWRYMNRCRFRQVVQEFSWWVLDVPLLIIGSELTCFGGRSDFR